MTPTPEIICQARISRASTGAAEAMAPHRIVMSATTRMTRPHAGSRSKAVAQMRMTAYSATLVCSAENRAITPAEVPG